ncbi:acetyltransferase [Shewanella gelidii]|uniref:PglD N-terminal domain-containing protein n=1 Tax=Shewanella gelidii TaxID=1642821 RepID=A0A917JJK7_9GAMM|nr:acetyltransferase [Shewanella gelidii]MCL1096419.1 acetyltransferase [Shewanella gelidii]GGI67274.1 hypothetical protein GCM10009332_00470 [Shewanella gelidii]
MSSVCAILGASGHGKVVAELAELNGYSEIKFFDDAWPHKLQVEHWSVVGNTQSLFESIDSYDCIVVAIGNNSVRYSKHREIVEAGAKCPPLIHPKAIVSNYAQIKEGTVVMAGAAVNPFSTIGEACVLNTNSCVDHDCALQDGVHISPNASLAGAVQVGEKAWVGIGAQVRQQIKIGPEAVVGAGATVVKDVPKGKTVVGNPAKIKVSNR